MCPVVGRRPLDMCAGELIYCRGKWAAVTDREEVQTFPRCLAVVDRQCLSDQRRDVFDPIQRQGE